MTDKPTVTAVKDENGKTIGFIMPMMPLPKPDAKRL